MKLSMPWRRSWYLFIQRIEGDLLVSSSPHPLWRPSLRASSQSSSFGRSSVRQIFWTCWLTCFSQGSEPRTQRPLEFGLSKEHYFFLCWWEVWGASIGWKSRYVWNIWKVTDFIVYTVKWNYCTFVMVFRSQLCDLCLSTDCFLPFDKKHHCSFSMGWILKLQSINHLCA